MITSIYASKLGMTQAWDAAGKRLAVTKCKINPNVVLGSRSVADSNQAMIKIGFGTKKLKNMHKPLKTIVEKSGFSNGVANITELPAAAETELKAGDTISVDSVIKVGDVVKVQGTTKGRGFAGGMKRHGFHGGPKTHGQSDRARAVGSIGAGTTPGKVLKGKKMPGHYGVDTQTVRGLVVLHIDQATNEVWLSGPVPGSINSTVKITNLGKTKNIELNLKASGLPEAKVEAETETSPEGQE